MAMQTNVVMKRDLKRVIIEHSLEEAREHGNEVLGWLVGFSTKDTVYICDAVPCTKYKRQTRYSAESDPSQESELASKFPRNVGIVGLYHSHPFKMDKESGEFRRIYGVSELFHSGTDDAMLRSRSSGMKNYVSIVTDIESISCYVMHQKRPKKIKENLVGDIDFTDYMRPINSKTQLYLEESFENERSLYSIIREMEEKLIVDVCNKMEGKEVSIQQGPIGNVMRIFSLEKDSKEDSSYNKGNYFSITPDKDELRVKTVMNLTPAIYVPKGYIDQDSAVNSMLNEIVDYIIYLTWNDMDYSEFEKHLSSKIKELEVHLGRISTKYDEKSGMPMKVFTKPKRRMSIKKR